MKKAKTRIFVLGLISLMFCYAKKTKEFDVREFGAIGDSITINTTAIQKAIDFCNDKGGGTVLLKNGIYSSGTILLKDNVKLHISADAKLVGSSNPKDYYSIDTFVDATGQERGTCLIGAKNAIDIGISGKGIIDGNGTAFRSKNLLKKMIELNLDTTKIKNFGANRPFLLRFVKSSKVTINNIQLRQPAAWTCHFYQSNNIVVNNVSIFSHAHQNNDGIDLDSSYNVEIKNCEIDTGDDAICFKTTSPMPTFDVKVSHCKLKSEWGAIKFGTESMGDFYNIEVKDCEIYETQGGGIKILSVDGANIRDVTIENIVMNKVDMPIFIRLGERLRTYRDMQKQEVGTIDNIWIKNIKAQTQDLSNSRVSPPSGIFITGTPNHKIGNVYLENIEVNLPGGGLVSQIKEVSEQINNYPEYSFFEVLPAYGIFGRHIKKLEMSKVKFLVENKEERKWMVLDDVEYCKNN